MAYRVYIKNDYKPDIVWGEPPSQRRGRRRRIILLACLALAASIWFAVSRQSGTIPEEATDKLEPLAVVTPPEPAEQPEPLRQPEAHEDPTPDDIEAIALQLPDTDAPPATPVAAASDWTEIRIKRGDSLAQIFKRRGLSPRDLHDILNSHELAGNLKHLRPGQIISVQTDGSELRAFRFELDLNRALLMKKQAGVFSGEIITTGLETQLKQTQGVINDSLFLAGQAAGLSDRLIMRLIDIYGWDIDFSQEIRKGDSFKLIHEEKYKGQKKVADGEILAAEFNNQGRKIRAVSFTGADGRRDYYTEDGASMRREFLRNPLEFRRISSHFNLKRKHPVLNRIRAHKGVDYAAATGTPIKTTGDGKVEFIGRKGGYGKTVIIRHGGNHSTLYAHLSRFRKGLKRGHAVEQGQTIGYVGMSGLATGPHLHYEFRKNGRHHNPLTVELPQAGGVPAAEMDKFRIHSSRLLALLDTSDAQLLAQYAPDL